MEEIEGARFPFPLCDNVGPPVISRLSFAPHAAFSISSDFDLQGGLVVPDYVSLFCLSALGVITSLICFSHTLAPPQACFQRFPRAGRLVRTPAQPLAAWMHPTGESRFPSLIQMLPFRAQLVFNTVNTSCIPLNFLLSDFAHCAQALMRRGVALAVSSVFPTRGQISVITPTY